MVDITLKRDFFKRKRLSVFGAILKIEEIIIYYSEANKEFNITPKFVDSLIKRSVTWIGLAMPILVRLNIFIIKRAKKGGRVKMHTLGGIKLC